ncbi:hypothetical protein H0H81_001304 [Sphagnurus paluster]|uniref:Xylanolytic transcriptional activator regulatory domain-containing protein n=1 Tax=Sphagnurus paluster TaxID=117069 RepID=A0A9P7FTB0_9AGAR|nr:hypothetical protein H0H81_001304 [Sphagnurus paluster]
MALPQFCTPGTPPPSGNPSGSGRRSLSVCEDDSPSQTEDQDPGGGTFQSGKWYGTSASGSIAPASVIEQLQNVGVPSPNLVEQGPSRQRTSGLHSGTRDKSLIVEDMEPSAVENLKSLVQECGVSPHKISELLQELPPPRLSEVLIDYYFSSMYAFCNSGNKAPTNFFRCETEIGQDIPSPSATSALLMRQFVLTSVMESERQIRTTSYLYHADRSYALVLGRPNSIQDDYTSTKVPSNIEDENVPPHPVENPPLSTPTPMTFVILRHQLARIIGRIVHHFQQVREKSSYSEVVALDDELLKFVTRLPPHFALHPDTSLDEKLKYIPVHRFLLITEILFVRISLHRPYILRRLSTDRFARSRAACFESAMKDFEVRQSFREAMPQETRESLSNAYREFQTAMISGIYLVLEPRGRDAAAMRAILDGFMKDHEGMREMDETTRRELKTIEFLQNKASQVERQGQLTNGNNEHQAHLLLGLQQSVSSPPRTFPSLLNISTSSEPSHSPSVSYANAGHMTQSPTFQRLQQTAPEHTQSPTNSGSPNTEEESPAQSLLDHWCNVVSNAQIDSTNGRTAWGGSGGADFSSWIGSNHAANGADSQLLSGPDISDWNYWEALVNQIQRAP